MGYFHEINTLHYRQLGIFLPPFPPYQIPEKEGNSKHVKRQKKQKTFWSLWSWNLFYLRFTHQGFSSWWADNLKSVAIYGSSDMATSSDLY